MSERGVTLLELIIALALGSIILLAGSAFYRTVTWYAQDTQAQAFLQNQAAIVVDELRRQIEAASLVAVTDGTDPLNPSCNGVTNTLYLAQPDLSVYCFYRSPSGQFMQYCGPCPDGTTGAWNMLAGSPTPLIVTSIDFCGSPPYATCQTTGDIAYLSFQLQAPSVRSNVNPTMVFTVSIGKRN